MRDFSKSHSSGATPNKSDDSYYSDFQNGVPFIRVQNLSVTGELDQSDLVYIARETHEGLLKRSQVKEHDLLVKITGVGRMAVASVAPDNFEGNINQHIVVIRTGSKEISENIAAFLNLDCAEKLATKRATGGTRPALDYPALFSMPVINDRRIYEKIQSCLVVKKQKELEAQRSLDSIDEYLLEELGINLAEPEENTIQNRVFYRNLSELTGQRFDSYYYKTIFENTKKSVLESKYPVHKLRNLSSNIQNGVEIRNYSDSGFRYLRVTDLGKYEINNNSPRYVDVDEIPSRVILNEKCLLVSRSGSLGLVSKVVPEIENAILSSHILKVELNTDIIIPEYAEAFLRSRVGQIEIFKENNGGVIPEINQTALGKILIPCPPLDEQLEIVEHIDAIRDRAKQLRQEAEADLEKAKQEVEAMIFLS